MLLLDGGDCLEHSDYTLNAFNVFTFSDFKVSRVYIFLRRSEIEASTGRYNLDTSCLW